MRTLPALLFLSLAGWAPADIRTESEIPCFGPGRTEKMDAHLPDDSFKRPVPAIILIHGGGWRTGDKADKRELSIARTLSENGYAVFSINYLLNVGERDEAGRLRITELAWPQNFYDCKSALRFVRAEADHFGIDPERIAVMGGSAGGHLAMLVGLTAEDDSLNSNGLYLEESNAVRCIVNFYGPHDLRGKKLTPFTGSAMNRNADLEALASPVTHLHAQSPPFFIAHGTNDKVIPVDSSRDLVQRLEALNIPFEYVEIPGAPHAFDLQPPQKDLRRPLLDFLQAHLGKPERVP